MRFLASEKLSKNKYIDNSGYLICQNAVLARTGKQTYLKSEIYPNCDDNSIIEIDRKPKEVFSDSTLASFENKPVTVEHPYEDVSPDNYRDLSVGYVRDVHKGTYNGEDVILGTLVITNTDVIEDIKNNIRTELSCGYTCDITEGDNPEQINIKGNHVALCEEGRAGIAKIVDTNKYVRDVTPKKEESKDEFIARFMEATKNEYPNEKQRYAIALSYWDKSKVKDASSESTIESLIKDEEEAIRGYKSALENASEKEKELYLHIIEEEEEHIEELKALLSPKTVKDYAPEFVIYVKEDGVWKVWGGSSTEQLENNWLSKVNKEHNSKYTEVQVVRNGEEVKDSTFAMLEPVDTDKYLIFEEDGIFKGTPVSNLKEGSVVRKNLVHRFEGFKSFDEVIDYVLDSDDFNYNREDIKIKDNLVNDNLEAFKKKKVELLEEDLDELENPDFLSDDDEFEEYRKHKAKFREYLRNEIKKEKENK